MITAKITNCSIVGNRGILPGTLCIFLLMFKTIFKFMHKFSFNTSVIVDVYEETSNLYFQYSSILIKYVDINLPFELFLMLKRFKCLV